MKRTIFIALLCLGIAGAAASFLPFEFLKPGIVRTLTRSLGRPVEIDAVHLALFAGPGFSLEGVTIHEDPRAGIEPFAYAGTVEARVDFAGLLHGRRGFSNLRLTDATVNLVKPEHDLWNFEMLMQSGGRATEMPSIQIRAARVNLKFGQTKSVFYFDDADLDVESAQGGLDVEVRLSGIPLRTDRPAQDFGHFFLRGTSVPSASGPMLNLSVDLEPSSLEALARLADTANFPLNGMASAQARLSGPPSALMVEGAVQLDDSKRARIVELPFRGSLSLAEQRMELASTGKQPWNVRLDAENLVASPRWQASLDLNEAPLAPIVSGLRRFNIPIPEKITAIGVLQGTLAYRSGEGFQGAAEVREASFSLPDVDEISSSALALRFNGPAVILRSAIFASKETGQTTQIDGSYTISGESAGLVLKIATKGLPLGDSAFLGFAKAPFLDRAAGGVISGLLQYRDDGWSGDYEVQDTEVALDGLAKPLTIHAAFISASSVRVAISRLQAEVDGVEVTGDYRWDLDDSQSAHRFRLNIQRVEGSAIARLFSPVLSREGGFLARTLRLGLKAAPDWFTQRKLDGAISVGTLDAWGSRLRVDTAHVLWNGAVIQLSSIDARTTQGAALRGNLSIDLSERAPKYKFEGGLNGVHYKGGDVSLQGSVEGAGNGAALLASLRGEGTLRGRAIQFTRDTRFRAVAGRFMVTAPNGAPVWKLSELAVTQGADLYLGEGGTQPDGKLALDLKNHAKQVHYTDTVGP